MCSVGLLSGGIDLDGETRRTKERYMTVKKSKAVHRSRYQVLTNVNVHKSFLRTISDFQKIPAPGNRKRRRKRKGKRKKRRWCLR